MEENAEASGEEAQLCLEDFRQFSENNKQWFARREFLTRHLHEYPGRKMDQLLAMSMVWCNIVYIGNRYGQQLTEKVLQMGEGIDVGEMPTFELVPGAKATKRPATSDAGKKRFGPRPRFEPVKFVVSTVEDDKQFQVNERKDSELSSQDNPSPPHTSNESFCDDDLSETQGNCSPFIFDPNVVIEQARGEFSNFMTRVHQNYSSKFETHGSDLSRDFRSNVLDVWKNKNFHEKTGFGFVKPAREARLRVNDTAMRYTGRTIHTLDIPDFFDKLATCVQENIQNALAAGSIKIYYTNILEKSLGALKTNPEYIYAPVKKIPQEDLARMKSGLPYGMACELRCQDVYVATGYSYNEAGSRDDAAEQAIKLLINSKVKVISAKRKCGLGYREDLLLCPIHSTGTELPPALKPENPVAKQGAKTLSKFVLVENKDAAVQVLKESAAHNKMKVNYNFTQKGGMWRCTVYIEGTFVAEGFGSRRTSQNAAARAAVKVLKKFPSNYEQSDNPECPGKSISLKDIVICQKGEDPIQILIATAHFNKVSLEFVLQQLSGFNFCCQVYIAQNLIAEGTGTKKSAKHQAAEAALAILMKTQPLVTVNQKTAPADDAISRNEIHDSFNMANNQQQIKSDNIGNQMLRKMGWSGGGLGKEGEGIAEPVVVKERFSREGLGLMTSNKKITKNDIQRIIQNYAMSENQEDLTFTRDLSPEERKHFHLMARKYGLKSKSYGKGRERFLTISRKWNNQELLRQLQQEGQVGAYTLVQPSQ
ncbi:hypothetical protein GDO81_003470 [Engystomops pustulosus]|uniref:NF-kappa-B-repressing factor n=1 Tax=Engystomops pustulosus TaxID=76066 RepID=A0AAV6ZZZ7_ENGPU|nr:hypothetical protein GDO81_003470 [Engystomops pustulosus]